MRKGLLDPELASRRASGLLLYKRKSIALGVRVYMYKVRSSLISGPPPNNHTIIHPHKTENDALGIEILHIGYDLSHHDNRNRQ